MGNQGSGIGNSGYDPPAILNGSSRDRCACFLFFARKLQVETALAQALRIAPQPAKAATTFRWKQQTSAFGTQVVDVLAGTELQPHVARMPVEHTLVHRVVVRNL